MSATNEIHPDEIAGERELPSVSARKPTSAKKGLGIMFFVVFAILGVAAAYYALVRSQRAKAAEPPPKEAQVGSSAPARLFGDAPPAPQEVPQEAVAAPVPLVDARTGEPVEQPRRGVQPAAPAKPKPVLDKSSAGLMVADQGNSAQDPRATAATPSGGVATLAPPAAQGDSGGLAPLLTGTRTDTRNAGVLTDRNLTLAKGAFIDCVLQTRLDTTVPGMSACVVTRNIFSDNGKVLLIERGSVVTGEYSQGLRQGQNRIFVLWNRVKTPNGVTIALDSPGTDPLGGSGLPGEVNNHFWKRFGAALLLSLVEDTAQGISDRQSRSGSGSNINYGSTSDATESLASKTLDSTINIPPTLYKNQGEPINIFVARDIYFGGVYAVRAQ